MVHVVLRAVGGAKKNSSEPGMELDGSDVPVDGSGQLSTDFESCITFQPNDPSTDSTLFRSCLNAGHINIGGPSTGVQIRRRLI